VGGLNLIHNLAGRLCLAWRKGLSPLARRQSPPQLPEKNWGELKRGDSLHKGQFLLLQHSAKSRGDRAQFLAGNAAFYTWPSLGCPSAIGWREELVAVVGRPTTAVLRGKGRFAFVGMFPHIIQVIK
jgi:hypothetical protein